MIRIAAVPVFLFLVSAPLSFADVITTIDFEGFADSTFLTNQYPGVSFANAEIITAGISLNAAEFPPTSGMNVAFDALGPVTITFSQPITSFQGFFTYTEALTLTAFNGAAQVDQATSLFSQNFFSSGNPPDELLSLASAGGITSVTLEADPGGGSFIMDDLTYVTPAIATPEPVSIALLGSMAGLILLARAMSVRFSRQFFGR